MIMPKLLETGVPPYLAVIFNYRLRDVDLGEYYRGQERLMNKALRLPGFYGEEAIRLGDQNGVSVSYWRSPEDIKEWRDDLDHKATRRLGIANWYQQYDLRVAQITRTYGLGRERLVAQSSSGKGGNDPLVVIFSSLRTDGDDEAYGQAAEEMAKLGGEQEGFLDMVSLKREDGYGITISYWRGSAGAAAWQANPTHRAVQKKGRERWYEDYRVRVGPVLRQKTFSR
jgi:heme-degrading monooxygenase HmoA